MKTKYHFIIKTTHEFYVELELNSSYSLKEVLSDVYLMRYWIDCQSCLYNNYNLEYIVPISENEYNDNVTSIERQKTLINSMI